MKDKRHLSALASSMHQKLFATSRLFALSLIGCPLLLQGVEYAEHMPLAHESTILGLDRSEQGIIAVGERGHILLSADNGVSWQQVPVPSRATLTAVHFPSPVRGWAVGHDNTILHSNDGGLSWEQQEVPGALDNSLLALHFFDDTHGFVVGAYGLFLRTLDGGQSWQSDTVFEEELHFNSIHATREGTLFMTLESGILLMSEDSGYTWDEIDSPYDGSLYGLLTTSHGKMLTFGLQGNLFVRETSGVTWKAVEMPLTNVLTNAIELKDGTIVVSSQGILCISRDGADSFQRWQPPDMRGLSDLIQAEDGSLIVGGMSGLHRFTSLP